MVCWKGKAGISMTIKKRLFVSNILMILVPVIITALMGLFCLGLVWLTVRGGGQLEMEHGDEFNWISEQVTEQIQEIMTDHPADWEERLGNLEELLTVASMRLTVVRDGETIYASEGILPADSELAGAISVLETDEATASANGSYVYLRQLETDDGQLSLYLFGTHSTHVGTPLKVVLSLSAILLLFAVFVSILLTNRFLTRFVFRRVEGPLDTLAAGAKELGAGHLDYRIAYEGQDEFKSVCDAFDEMALHLKASISQTIQEEESRKELLGGISHDLRSPLTSIQAYVEGLLDGVAQTPEDQRRYLHTIKAKTEDITRLVSQLFLFSQLELEEYPVALRSMALDRWLTDRLEEWQPEYRAKGLELAAQLEPASIQADPEQLRRVLTNILDNSTKYKTAPVGNLTLTLTREGGQAVLTLADDGPGVPEDALPKLFDVFYRSDPARQNPAGGSGLGLAIAAKAVAQMGGTITARNGTAGGLTILIAFPEEEEDYAENPDCGG